MEIAKLCSKVTFQKCITEVDEYGNHRSTWADTYTCHAMVSREGMEDSKEIEVAGITAENPCMSLTVRYCRETAAVSAAGYRLILDGEIYDIFRVDHMSYRKRTLRFVCRRARR